MAATAAPAGPHTDAIDAALVADGLLVGRGHAPDGGGWQGEPGRSDFKGYVVLWPYPGRTDGDLCDPNSYLDYTVQTTVVGAIQDQAEQVMDAVKAALVGVRLAVAGRSAYPVQLSLDLPARRDDQVSPPEHYCIAQFTMRTEPAA